MKRDILTLLVSIVFGGGAFILIFPKNYPEEVYWFAVLATAGVFGMYPAYWALIKQFRLNISAGVERLSGEESPWFSLAMLWANVTWALFGIYHHGPGNEDWMLIFTRGIMILFVVAILWHIQQDPTKNGNQWARISLCLLFALLIIISVEVWGVNEHLKQILFWSSFATGVVGIAGSLKQIYDNRLANRMGRVWEAREKLYGYGMLIWVGTLFNYGIFRLLEFGWGDSALYISVSGPGLLVTIALVHSRKGFEFRSQY